MKIKDREQHNLSTRLAFVDLDLAKAAVLASLCSPGSRRCYEHAMPSSSIGIAPNLVWDSIRSWWHGIARILSHAD
jgi:hypothetical protein